MDRDDEMAHKIITCRSPWCWSCRCCGCIIFITYLSRFNKCALGCSVSCWCESLISLESHTMLHIRSALPADPEHLCSDLGLILEKNVWALKAGCSVLPWLTHLNTPHSSNIKFDHDIIRKHHISWCCIVCPWIPSFTAPHDCIVKSNISCGGTIISKKLNCHHDICLKLSHW